MSHIIAGPWGVAYAASYPTPRREPARGPEQMQVRAVVPAEEPRTFQPTAWGDGDVKNRMRKFTCRCGVIIRATVTTFQGARCLRCGDEFMPAQALAVGRAVRKEDEP